MILRSVPPDPKSRRCDWMGVGYQVRPKAKLGGSRRRTWKGHSRLRYRGTWRADAAV